MLEKLKNEVYDANMQEMHCIKRYASEYLRMDSSYLRPHFPLDRQRPYRKVCHSFC